MKAFALVIFESLIEAFYPPTPEGAPRKLKASAGGLALVLCVVVGGLNWLEARAIRAEQETQRAMVAEVKTGVGMLWEWALTGKIRRASGPATAQTDVDIDAAARVAASDPFRLFSSAEAGDGGPVGVGVSGRARPAAAPAAATDRVR